MLRRASLVRSSSACTDLNNPAARPDRLRARSRALHDDHGPA
jgi:hypothetical protein